MTRPDLYDVVLAGQFASEWGREICPLCGTRISEGDDVLVTDSGEVHADHGLTRPVDCLRVEESSVLLGETVVGYVHHLFGEWWAFRPDSSRPFGPHATSGAAAVAAFGLAYPEKRN